MAVRPGPLMRPIEQDTFLRLARAPWIFYLVAGLSGVALLLSPGARHHIRHLDLAVVGVATSLAVSVVVFFFVEIRPGFVSRHYAWLSAPTIVLGGALTSVGLVVFGPDFGVIALAYPEGIIFAYVLFTVPWALMATALIALESGLVVLLQDGWFGSLGQWAFLVSASAGMGLLAGQMAARMIASTAAEHVARTELAALNANLQHRVDEQVAALERAGQLRRFLAPQVADAVLSGSQDDLLKAHRRRVAVFFCDLRGFTRFAAQVEPEDVIDVLGTYYRVVGERLHACNATVGSFAGDGIMAYLNDPVPCDAPARTAVEMARSIRTALAQVIAEWRRLGYDLGFGIGIAVGHATLGVVGFEGRQDYTALGTVVNLAARLCSAAAPDQILIDPHTARDIEGTVALEPITGLALKGFPAEMEAYAVG